VVILTVIPPGPTAANQTTLNDGCRADRGRAEASCSKLHRGPLLGARTEPGKIPREGSAILHELLLLCPSKNLGVRLAASVRFSSRAAASQNAQTDRMVVSRRGTRLLLLGPANITVSRVSAGPVPGADCLGDPMVWVLLPGLGALERPGPRQLSSAERHSRI
jgi:hypothetical protein